MITFGSVVDARKFSGRHQEFISELDSLSSGSGSYIVPVGRTQPLPESAKNAIEFAFHKLMISCIRPEDLEIELGTDALQART
jgi:hypothetical protein